MKLDELLNEGTGYMSGEFDYHVELPWEGEVRVRVYYDYQPEEPQSRNYPGAHEEVTITSVISPDGTDVLDYITMGKDSFANDELDKMEQAALEHETDVRVSHKYDSRY